jgi:hypothetical protein
MKIAVASGKGGTGKTTAPTNLAWVAAQSGLNVAYLDCDVEEPNGHLFLKPATTVADCGAKKGGARMTTGNILSVRGLGVRFGNRSVLQNLSFDVAVGLGFLLNAYVFHSLSLGPTIGIVSALLFGLSLVKSTA